jgi:sialic acid synthase SpsE
MKLPNKLTPSNEILIDEKRISNKDPVYFIAEIGSNFDQDLIRAKELIYMAKEAGADAAKFQHYTANSLVSDIGFKKIGSKSSHQSQWKKSVYETYKDASLNQDWTRILQETCCEAEISFFTSPYSLDLIDYIDEYVPAYKVGSGDITWIEIIEYMASKGKPIFLATGASEMVDVKRAADAILNITSDLIILQCNTNYTAHYDNYAHIQLEVLSQFKKMYPNIITGLSDHMPGHVAVLGAVALGAKVIEKHFTDSTGRIGPDHSFSMTPNSWREMVDRTRELEASLGDGNKRIEENEKETVIVQRRSICAATDLEIGSEITKQDLSMLRPCPDDAIPPYEVCNLIGKVINRKIHSGENIKWNDLIDKKKD